MEKDEDLDALSKDDLVAEVKRLRAAIRLHRDRSGHAVCRHHPERWTPLPDPVPQSLLVPDWPQFLRGCVRYGQSLDRQLSGAPRTDAELGDGPA